jgi:hypothetical protein
VRAAGPYRDRLQRGRRDRRFAGHRGHQFGQRVGRGAARRPDQGVSSRGHPYATGHGHPRPTRGRGRRPGRRRARRSVLLPGRWLRRAGQRCAAAAAGRWHGDRNARTGLHSATARQPSRRPRCRRGGARRAGRRLRDGESGLPSRRARDDRHRLEGQPVTGAGGRSRDLEAGAGDQLAVARGSGARERRPSGRHRHGRVRRRARAW